MTVEEYVQDGLAALQRIAEALEEADPEPVDRIAAALERLADALENIHVLLARP